MEFASVLKNRRSIRSYTGAPLSDAQLDAVLAAAEQAPVAMGQYQNYHLTVVQDPAVLDAIEEACATVFHRHGSKMLYGAPTLVIVSATGNGNADYASAGIIAHTMALEAVNQQVGYCYIWGAIAGLDQSPATLAKLNLPAGFTPACAVVLGQSDDTYAPRDVDQTRIGVTKL